VSETSFLDILLLSIFVEGKCFFLEPFFLDLLLFDCMDLFFSEALDFVFRDSSEICLFLDIRTVRGFAFFYFETAALDLPLLDLDFSKARSI
jgi:hypothetical protein